MKLASSLIRKTSGYVLLLTMVFVALGALLLMAMMNWTSATSRNTSRNNEYYTSAAAAEAATEKVFIHMSRDYLSGGGEGVIYNNLSLYSALLPTAAENPYWTNFMFTNAFTGGLGLYVDRSQPSQYAVLNGQYSGLYGQQAIYRVVANAIQTNSQNQGVVAAIQQDLGVESIPLFQFAVFYNGDMEMCPSPVMNVNGRVHANGNIYLQPTSTLTFSNDVTCSGTINLNAKPGDPSNRGISSPDPYVVFMGEHDGGTSTLNLPLLSSNVYSVLTVPPNSTNTTYMYNKADMLITINPDSSVTLSGGPNINGLWTDTNQWLRFLSLNPNVPFANPTNPIPPTAIYLSLYTNATGKATNYAMWNARERSYMQLAVLDIGRLRTWIASTNNPIQSVSGVINHPMLNQIWIVDNRPLPYAYNGTNCTEPGIFITNGAQLPAGGLTISTPDPIYVCGNYNVTTDGTNFSLAPYSTTYTRPAALMADAITVLSGGWQIQQGALGSAPNVSGNDTVNAAFLTGICPTAYYSGSANGTGNFYSGGVENLPRFLENWGSYSFNYNGSMVVMFNSQIAVAPWPGTGYSYSPPVRKWAFDMNYTNNALIPPGTPQILFLERLSWAFQPAGFIGN